MTRSLRGRRALITGGSLGIGLALARRLVREGMTLTLVARRLGPLEEARASLLAAGASDVRILALDLADADALQALLPRELDAAPIDLLVNNAGLTHPGRMLELDDAVYERLYRVNQRAPILCTRLVAPRLVAQGGGTIVNIGSVAGDLGVYGYSAYAASKFALHGFTACVRAELAPLGIQVHLVMPPDTDTPMFREERALLPPETAALAGVLAPLSAEHVADDIVDGIKRGRYEILPGTASRWTVRFARWFPALERWISDGIARRARRGQP